MYIRAIKKKKEILSGEEKGLQKTYGYLQLIETIRTPKGPRQKLLLSLGTLAIEKKEYKVFVEMLEHRMRGQEGCVQERFLANETNPRLQEMVEATYQRLLAKRSESYKPTESQVFERVDTNSYQSDDHVSMGAEYVCNHIWNQLKLSDWLKAQGVSETTAATIYTLVLGRLIAPGSERATYAWANSRSAIQEFHPQKSSTRAPISLSQYYRSGDVLFGLKERLEAYLSQTERALFTLNEKLVFYDLTNTYLEGQALANKKAKRGRSKEKRSDCKLLTLGLVVDENGFAKRSELFAGNQSECKTLQEMVRSLEGESVIPGRTVVLDAGIATRENTDWLKANGYHYIVCHRGNCPFDIQSLDKDAAEIIRQDEAKGIRISVQQKDHGDERYLVCHSQKREHTDSSIRSAQESHLLEALSYYKAGLSLPRRAKTFQKVSEMIGRLKEKYARSAKLYTIEMIVDPTNPAPHNPHPAKTLVTDLIWKKNQPLHESETEAEGQYILRTDRMDIAQEEIWQVYVMLTRVESSFRSLKSHLGLRPNFHQLEQRADAHLFISVIAYHILHIIEYKLRLSGDHRCWDTLRKVLSTHQRYTLHYSSLVDNQTVQNHLRLSSSPSVDHLAIYKVFRLDGIPFKKRGSAFKM